MCLAPTSRLARQRSKAYLKKRDFGLAIRDLTDAVALDPNFLMALLQRGALLLTQGRCDEAVVDYERVLAVDSTKKDAQKKLPEARECASLLRQGDAHFGRHQWQAALEMFDRVLQIKGLSSAPLLLKKAECEFHMGQFHEAAATTAQVLKLDKGLLRGYELRGNAFYHIGDFNTAITHYQQGLK